MISRDLKSTLRYSPGINWRPRTEITKFKINITQRWINLNSKPNQSGRKYCRRSRSTKDWLKGRLKGMIGREKWWQLVKVLSLNKIKGSLLKIIISSWRIKCSIALWRIKWTEWWIITKKYYTFSETSLKVLDHFLLHSSQKDSSTNSLKNKIYKLKSKT